MKKSHTDIKKQTETVNGKFHKCSTHINLLYCIMVNPNKACTEPPSDFLTFSFSALTSEFIIDNQK